MSNKNTATDGSTIILKCIQDFTKEQSLHRHDFIEIIVRIANYINKNDSKAKQNKEQLSDTMLHMLTEVVFPNS